MLDRLRSRFQHATDVLALSRDNRRLAENARHDGCLIADLTRKVASLQDANDRAAGEIIQRSIELGRLQAHLGVRDCQLDVLERQVTDLRTRLQSRASSLIGGVA